MIQRINEAVTYIKEQYNKQLLACIVPGGRYGNFVNQIQVEKEIPYCSIPDYLLSTLAGLAPNRYFANRLVKPGSYVSVPLFTKYTVPTKWYFHKGSNN